MLAANTVLVIQNVFVMLVMAWSFFSFCSGKKKKGETVKEKGKNETETAATGNISKEDEENEKPPVVALSSETNLVDREGYIRHEEDGDELRTLKYLEEFKPPQTLPYSVEEISAVEKAYERLHPEMIIELHEHKIRKYPKHKQVEKDEMRKKEEEERKVKESKEVIDKKDKGRDGQMKKPGQGSKTWTMTE